MWIDQQLGGGVVFTRKNTALRPDELLGASYVRMLPGNVTELYPDVGYDPYRLNLKEGWSILDMHFMTFEGGFDYLLVVQDDGEIFGGNRDISIFDISDFQNPGSLVDPVLQRTVTSGIVATSCVNRGAEYFFNSVCNVNPNLKVGQQMIFYHDGTDIKTRSVGLAPSQLDISATRSTPTPGNDLWSMTQGISSAAPGRIYTGGGDSEFYNVITLLYNHLYGSYNDMLEEWGSDSLRNNAWNLGLEALRPQSLGGPQVDQPSDWSDERTTRILRDHFVPVTKVALRLEGQGYVFLYWATEYDNDYAVESAPTDVAEITSGEGLTAKWEVTVDWEKFYSDGHAAALYNDMINDNPKRYGLPDGSGSSSAQVRQLVARDYMNRLQDAYNAGRTRAQETGSFPLAKAQENLLVTQLDISGYVGGTYYMGQTTVISESPGTPDEIRIYRQNVGFYSDYFLEWNYGENDPTQAEPVGEGPRNAEDIREGRVNRQGGLLTTISVEDYVAGVDSYEDDYSRSGVGDPGLAFPTVNYVTRGGLGVFPYLRRPNPSVAMCNMAQSLLRVERWYNNGLDENIILVAPVEDPEQAPLIYSIPIVTERQDTITDLRPLGDTALVFTTTSLLQINYIPFEGYNQQDRVVTQITGNHGASDNRRGTLVETPLGQIYVWLSATSLMATNGRGAWDICPDFSVEEAEARGYDFSNARLVNNAAQHRLELWAGGSRFDFLYHRSQMKDIRGDGAGLSLKMLGPTPWYATTDVAAACAGTVGSKFRTFHVTQRDSGSAFTLHMSNDQPVPDRLSSVTTRKIWAKDPTGRLKTKAVGLEYGDAIESPRIITLNQPVNPDVAERAIDQTTLPINRDRGFSSLSAEDGMGGGAQYQIFWTGDGVGPLWLSVEAAPGGFGS